MQSNITTKKFENGLTLIAESMPWLQSASFSFAVPAGCRFDPVDRLGLANFASEMVQRGCGELDSRDFIEKLEMLGVDFSSSVSVYHGHFGGALPAPNLIPALKIYADVFRSPLLPQDQLEDARMVCLQEIRALEDDLTQKVILQLRARQYGQPLGRSSHGTYESIAAITHADIVKFHQQQYQPDGLILSVAGNIDWELICDEVEKMFAEWKPVAATTIANEDSVCGIEHIQFDSQQTHIALAFPAIPYSDDNYFVVRGAVGVLSDGMSSRLFSEIREKRGLCYSVFASLHTLKDRGSIISYVGTGADRAQQSLDVLVEQLTLLSEGITQDELDRLKIQVRSSLVMQQESSRSRAASISGDYFHLGYARSLDDVNKQINNLTTNRINDYLQNHPPEKFNLVTLGPARLELDNALSKAAT